MSRNTNVGMKWNLFQLQTIVTKIELIRMIDQLRDYRRSTPVCFTMDDRIYFDMHDTSRAYLQYNPPLKNESILYFSSKIIDKEVTIYSSNIDAAEESTSFLNRGR